MELNFSKGFQEKRYSMRTHEMVSFERVDAIVNHLDLFSRILIGQYDEVIALATGQWMMSFHDPELNAAVRLIRDNLIPEICGYDLNSSLGIWSDDTPLIAKRAYDIQQCLRYQMAYHRHPEGGITVNFREPFLHGEWDKEILHLDEYHEILRKQCCGSYQPGYSILHPWACPVLLHDFSDNNHQVELIIDDHVVQKIIDFADKWFCLVKENKLYDLFKEASQFAHGKIEEEKLHTLCDFVMKKVKELPN